VQHIIIILDNAERFLFILKFCKMFKNFIKNIYIIFSIILGGSFLLSRFDYQFYGYYTGKTIAWIWILLTFIFILIFWKSRRVKYYFLFLLILIPLSVIPMKLPYYAIEFYLTNEEDFQKIKLNEDFRIERTRQNVLSMPRVYFYQRKLGIFEKNICRPAYDKIVEEILDISSESDNLDFRKIPIQSIKLISINKDNIGVEYKIMNKSKIIYHNLKSEYDFDFDGV